MEELSIEGTRCGNAKKENWCAVSNAAASNGKDEQERNRGGGNAYAYALHPEDQYLRMSSSEGVGLEALEGEDDRNCVTVKSLMESDFGLKRLTPNSSSTSISTSCVSNNDNASVSSNGSGKKHPTLMRSKSDGFITMLTHSNSLSDVHVTGPWCGFDVMGATIVTPRSETSQGFYRYHDIINGDDKLYTQDKDGDDVKLRYTTTRTRAGSASLLDIENRYHETRRLLAQLHAAPDIALPNARGGPKGSLPSKLALDIGGSLIKMVYFDFDQEISAGNDGSGLASSVPLMGGRLHFAKWEVQEVLLAMEFIKSKKLIFKDNEDNGNHSDLTREKRNDFDELCRPRAQTDSSELTTKFEMPNQNSEPEQEQMHAKRQSYQKSHVNATGGGAHKYAQMFKDGIDVHFHKCDEMDCLVHGSNFLLQEVADEAYTFLNNKKHFVPLANNGELFPYLLVSIGSGVSIIKVDGVGQWERVSGTNLGGGTFVGLGRLLTGCSTFDELLELSLQGDNTKVDMLVGDIYGTDYSHIGLSSTTIASSFGKISGKTGADANSDSPSRADIALSLVRMISYNIGHIAYLNAMQYGLKRILFGGYFLRGNPYTMETISFAINFWSKGSMKALFLRHEGFLGALGAFLKSVGVALK